MVPVLQARVAEDAMYGAEANDRELYKWLGKVQNREITLPLQRGEAWDHSRICSLMNAIIKEVCPLGVTLILEVGDKPKVRIARLANGAR